MDDKTFEVLFSRKVWYKARVKARSEEEAREKFARGEYVDEEMSDTQPDYWKEEIIDISEVDEEDDCWEEDDWEEGAEPL